VRWLLPEHIDDILPDEAMRIELLRRSILDLFFKYDYQLIIPPLIEFTDSLLTGTGRDLDLRTFKLVDQLSGKMMGVRADITPQAARIDAHLLNRRGVTRLCYCGSVLHARPATPSASREPIQIGAELFGERGIAGDLEIQGLLCRALAAAGVKGARMDIGHVAVFGSLVQAAGLGLGGDRLLVRHARPADDNVHLHVADQLVSDDLQMQLPHAFDDGLARLVVVVAAEAGVLAADRGQGVAQLVLVALALGLDAH